MNPTTEQTLARMDEIRAKIDAEEAAKKAHTSYRGNGSDRRVDVPMYCSDNGVSILKVIEAPGGGDQYCLEKCAINPSHSPNESSIIQRPNGQLLYQCFHETCKGVHWTDARRAISGDKMLTEWLVGGNGQNGQSVNSARPMTEEEAEREAIRMEGSGGPQSHGDNEKHKHPWELPEWQSKFKPEGSFPFTPYIEGLKAAKPVEYLIDNTLYADGLGLSFGDTGTIKSFDKIDQGMCVATETPYHGRKVKQGGVFYICGEGRNGIFKRIKGWAEKHGIDLGSDVPFFVSNQSAELLEESNVKAILSEIQAIEAATGIRIVMVIIDTTNTNLGKGDDGNPKDMTTVMFLMRKYFSGRSYHLVCHVGLADGDRPRGFSGQIQNSDTAHAYIKISGRDHPIRVKVSNAKMKEGAKTDSYILESEVVPVQLGLVLDSTLVLKMSAEGTEAAAAESEKQVVKLKGQAFTALTILRSMYSNYRQNLKTSRMACNTPQVMYSDWFAACLAHGMKIRANNFKARIFDKLLLHDLIKTDKKRNFVYLADMTVEGSEIGAFAVDGIESELS